MAHSACIGALLCVAAQAQFISSGTAVPRTPKLPVVFLNGYQSDCPQVAGNLNHFRSTFGMADEILGRNGQVTLFFDSCSIPNRPALETLGKAFGDFLTALRYADGQPVPQVDVVVHSMGGLIVRSYLSGKQPDSDVFVPPADTRIRKLVFLGTPHFGTPIAGISLDRNKQIEQIETGSRFVFDLATWNQGIDDLRGVDAITVLGNAGTGALVMPARFDDSTVRLTSGSLEFVLAGRTRILNFCHTGGLASGLCISGAERLANLTSDTHDSARIIISFLNGAEEWRSIGQPAGENMFLSSRGGIAIAWKDANDRPLSLQSAVAGQDRFTVRSGQIGSNDFLPAQALQLALTSTTGATATFAVPVSAGFTRALTLKAGPSVAAVVPSFAAVFPRSVAPGMFISIYGTDLATNTTQATGLPYPTILGTTEVRLSGALLPLHYASPVQINAVMPEPASGLAKLMVKSAAGEHTVNVLIEPAVPAVFTAALNALSGVLVTADSPLRAGDYVSLFLTGLGATVRRDGLDWAVTQPQVTIGGKACELLYAGRAPGFIGLDQVNCRLAQDLTANNSTPVAVRSGNRVSNTVNLPVR